MSDFEKLIIPLIDDCIWPIDLTSCAGFIDSYTSDPDKPCGEKEFFLVYNDNIRNEYVSNRMKRFETSPKIKRRYVKYVKGIPYYIYSFWVDSSIKDMYSGIVTMNTEQKARILQFWGPFEKCVDDFIENNISVLNVHHPMPLEDYTPSYFEKNGLTINKKGVTSKDVTPFIFLNIV